MLQTGFSPTILFGLKPGIQIDLLPALKGRAIQKTHQNDFLPVRCPLTGAFYDKSKINNAIN